MTILDYEFDDLWFDYMRAFHPSELQRVYVEAAVDSLIKEFNMYLNLTNGEFGLTITGVFDKWMNRVFSSMSTTDLLRAIQRYAD